MTIMPDRRPAEAPSQTHSQARSMTVAGNDRDQPVVTTPAQLGRLAGGIATSGHR